ncbi:MAG: hypothetical protein M3P85_11615 [Actinomycetota bacterium]|nr:hypothetical protein [Actinomycetota bacterium]
MTNLDAVTQGESLKRYLDAGIALTQMTRDRAEAIVRELVKAGEVQREQAQERVEELVDRGRKSSDALMEMVRKEIARQLAGMGLVTRQDLVELEARLETRNSPASPSPPARPVAGEPAADEPTPDEPAAG